MWIRVTALHFSRHPAVSPTAKTGARLGLLLAGRYHDAMPRCLPVAVAVVLILALAPAAAVGADTIPGPITARVVSVYDGDTLTVDADPWPGLTARTKVRVAGVDTPEVRGECQAEKDLAVRARDFVRSTVGAQVQLTDVRLGKYAGRVVAEVWVNEQKLSDLLIAENLGRPYRGGRREGWCP